MIVVLKPEATAEVATELLDRIAKLGLRPLHLPGTERIVLGALGDERVLATLDLAQHPMVESVKPILAPYKLVGRELHPHDTIIDLGHGVIVGGGRFTVVAGPCAIESRESLTKSADIVKKHGAVALRGGAYKPRTSPYTFQGLGQEGLELIEEVGGQRGMPTVTEVLDTIDVDAVERHASVLQIGARNMQNFRLLSAVGRTKKPVLLKRGLAAKIEDLLLAAEYILAEGNPNVILCERGIRTFETATRNTLDLAAVPYLKEKSHLPVFVDPSHGTGIRSLVPPMALAALACGADGVLIEVHHDPKSAWSDGAQSLDEKGFEKTMHDLRKVAAALGRVM